MVMGSEPSNWATRFDSAPPSDTTSAPDFKITDIKLPQVLRAGEQAQAFVTLKNSGVCGSLSAR